MNQLNLYGYNTSLEARAADYPALTLCRVLSQHRRIYQLMTPAGEIAGTVSGRFCHGASGPQDYPAVGDWVMADVGPTEAVIQNVLARRSVFMREAAGFSRDQQVVCANVDLLLYCMSMNENFNLRRLERYIAAVKASGAGCAVVLTKQDLCADPAERIAQTRLYSGGAQVLACSLAEPDSFDAVRALIAPGATVACVGSSGVGKSTLINALLGEERLTTARISGEGRGRHTTTSREMLPLPGGGVMIDTPGMRELKLEQADVDGAFEEIEALAADCRFSDCAHQSEPGCAVRAAVQAGTLSQKRLDAYHKLQKEMARKKRR